jgi:acyl phosphate:glycerol-3-phosphate acyltransferase
MQDFQAVVILIGSYLIGSVSFAVVVSKAMGLPDPHTYGSGNPGATNVLRTGNKMAAILTLLGDALKGFVAVKIAQSVPDISDWLLGGVVVAVFLGHLFPLYHQFKGGKGVATAAGVLFGIDPALGLFALLTWLIIAFFFRYSSLAALATAAFAPFYCIFLFGNYPIFLAVLVMGILLIWRHQANIQNLLNGVEGKIGQKGQKKS